MILHRIGEILTINGERFNLSDLVNVLPQYDKGSHIVHYYDGKKHYVSDGRKQVGCGLPYPLAEKISFHINEMRMCRNQRQMDDKYFENLRKGTRQ